LTINRQAKNTNTNAALETLGEALSCHTLSIDCPSCQTAFVMFDRRWLESYDSKMPLAWLSSEIKCPHCGTDEAVIAKTYSIVKAMSQ